ncbi:MAG: response regulator, partial [Chitinophagaceae bacterium]|nr:response regulator [Chitinophagaceae bacterium]
MIKVIIVDDELMARNLLKGLLKEYCPNVEVLADCADLPNGVKAIRKYKPDLVFLDIEMPGHTGLELLEFFDEDEIDFAIIFTTAYNQYAIRAFKLSAIDYLLKPIEPSDLEQSIERFKKLTDRNRQAYETLKENLSQQGIRKIAVPEGNTVKFLELDQILFFKADSSYTEIHFTDGRKMVISRTLKNIEDTLDNQNTFFRCHKSYLVNVQYITGYIKSDGGYIIMNDNTEIPLSGDRIQEL